MAARESWISGASNMGAVQTSVGLWEGCLSLSDVTGTDLLSRRDMALAGRALALRGEAVFLIRDRLMPAIDWDISTRNGDPDVPTGHPNRQDHPGMARPDRQHRIQHPRTPATVR